MKRTASEAATMAKGGKASVRSNQKPKPMDKGKPKLLPLDDAPSCFAVAESKKRTMIAADDDTSPTKRFKPSPITNDMEALKPKTPPNQAPSVREALLVARKKKFEINQKRMDLKIQDSMFKGRPSEITYSSSDSEAMRFKRRLERQEFRLEMERVERRALARPLFQDNSTLMPDFYQLIL